MPCQLLNRNPKHRLGAQRDAAELKEHPFFKSIDWEALARKQVTPPFKPVVEPDEPTSNFDPEFTSADISHIRLVDDLTLDDDDPSEDWVSQSVSGGPAHTSRSTGQRSSTAIDYTWDPDSAKTTRTRPRFESSPHQ